MGKGITYIILAAGIGKKLYPLTLDYSKTSFKLDENTTILQRMIRKIRENDVEAEIVVVLGYQADKIKEELCDENVKYVINPFYKVTNSIASLWFARKYLERQNVVVMNGDIVLDDNIISKFLTVETKYPYILVDLSNKNNECYKAVLKDDKVLVLSKALEKYDASYIYALKLDSVSSRIFKSELENLINKEMYNLFCEDALVNLIMFDNFELFFKDVSGYNWVEVNTVDDLLVAKTINDGEVK